MIYDQLHIDGNHLVIETIQNDDGKNIIVLRTQLVRMDALRAGSVAVMRGECVGTIRANAMRRSLRVIPPITEPARFGDHGSPPLEGSTARG